MSSPATKKPQEEVTLFDAKERFYTCRMILDKLGEKLESIVTKRHPGVIDLMEQFGLLRRISMQAAQKIEGQDQKDDLRPLKPRALHLINTFEYLVYDFQKILEEAHAELADYERRD